MSLTMSHLVKIMIYPPKRTTIHPNLYIMTRTERGSSHQSLLTIIKMIFMTHKTSHIQLKDILKILPTIAVVIAEIMIVTHPLARHKLVYWTKTNFHWQCQKKLSSMTKWRNTCPHVNWKAIPHSPWRACMNQLFDPWCMYLPHNWMWCHPLMI